jgi:tRNA A37 methylthiotransferase MiaB
MTHKVDPQTKALRSARIRRIGAAKRQQFYTRHLDQVVEVLFEHQENGSWVGYTGNYIRVAVRSSECLENELRMVHLEHIHGDYAAGFLAETADVCA